ncbi:MAG: T9SS type A sorting domain-containing protein [Saprospiraceae bacterium]|nr:T9SS type A sorting domain-containing protein [Saprospiraceae bacterium]
MHQLRNKNTRLLRYSNPDVSHNGHPTGISNERDNARWIRTNNGCTVSNYNPVDPIFPLLVYIWGENLLCKPFWGDFYAIATGSGSPYSYEWHVSTDGINWGMVAGTQQSISLNSNDYDTGSNVFLRVRVTNMLGNVEFAFFTVTIISPTDYAACYRSNDLISEDDRAAVRVYPNPASDNLNVSLTVLEEGSQVSIQLYTVTGIMVAEINQVLGAGEYHEVLPTKGAAAGSFLLRLKIGQKTYDKLIIKQ